MTHKKFTIALNGLLSHENIIFKLICSVSERTKNRAISYSLATQNQQADIYIHDIKQKEQSVADKNLNVWVTDKKDDNNDTISRPLIATRVLATLDKLTESISANTAHTPHTEASPDKKERKIDITEEEASELAIVHDQTLENPANHEESPPESNPELTLVKKEYPARKITHHQPHVLVVDDSLSVRKQLEIELDLFDVAVDYAENGETALQLLKQHQYDMALLDVVLPDKDGFLICKHIKTTSKNTITIMLTGKATQADKIKGSLAGCDDYLIKPVGRHTFQKAVKQYLPIKNINTAIEA